MYDNIVDLDVKKEAVMAATKSYADMLRRYHGSISWNDFVLRLLSTSPSVKSERHEAHQSELLEHKLQAALHRYKAAMAARGWGVDWISLFSAAGIVLALGFNHRVREQLAANSPEAIAVSEGEESTGDAEDDPEETGYGEEGGHGGGGAGGAQGSLAFDESIVSDTERNQQTDLKEDDSAGSRSAHAALNVETSFSMDYGDPLR